MFKKKEILIIFVLAVLVTLSGIFFGDPLCRRGFPCGFYYDYSYQPDSSIVYDIYCPACPFLPVSPQTIDFLYRLEISFDHHSFNAFLFVDLLFWFLVLAGGWWVVKWTLKRA